MTDEKKYNIYWTKQYDDGRVVEHKSIKNWPFEEATRLARAGEKLTGGKPHIIREVDRSIPLEVVKNG